MNFAVPPRPHVVIPGDIANRNTRKSQFGAKARAPPGERVNRT